MLRAKTSSARRIKANVGALSSIRRKLRRMHGWQAYKMVRRSISCFRGIFSFFFFKTMYKTRSHSLVRFNRFLRAVAKNRPKGLDFKPNSSLAVIEEQKKKDRRRYYSRKKPQVPHFLLGELLALGGRNSSIRPIRAALKNLKY